MFTGVHHLKFPVTDIDVSVEWYERAFGVHRITRFDHYDEDGRLYAAMLFFPGVPSPVELRHAPEAAVATAGYDPVTFGVADAAALDELVRRLDDAGIEHSPKVAGFIGDVIGVTSPDGLVIRIYTDPVGGFENVEMDAVRADIHNAALSTPLMSE